MRVLGVSFAASEATFALLEGTRPSFSLLDSPKKLELGNHEAHEDLRSFQATLNALLTDLRVDRVGHRQCSYAGLYTAGAAAIKMEALLQVADVSELYPITTKRVGKTKREPPVAIPAGLARYQQEAFWAGYAALPE